MPRISVIVPARDVDSYVGALLGDLRDQTFTDAEFVVIDDASTDATGEVISRFAEDDPRFRPLSGDGSGSSTARNQGLKHAAGELIAFVDADDRLSPRYLELLHTAMTESGSDLASCNVRRLDGYVTRPSPLHMRAFHQPEVATHLSRAPRLLWDTTIWNKLAHRSLWDGTAPAFDEGRWINDLYPSVRLHVAARQVDLLEDVLYFWRVRRALETSITDRKLADPAARLKSLEDRSVALDQACRLLADKLPVPEVLTGFGERILAHDLWIYLPFYTAGDDSYRTALVDHARDLMTCFDIDPTRHPLGPLLVAVYRAVLEDDRERLDVLLDPATEVVAEVERGRLRTRVRAPASPAAAWPDDTAADLGRVRATPRGGLAGALLSDVAPIRPRRATPGGGDLDSPLAARRGSSALLVEARIDRIELLPPGHGPSTVRGVVRVRDGRSDLEGPWTVSIALLGHRGTKRLPGPRTQLAPAPDRHLHPLQRSGWRSFLAELDVTATLEHRSVQRWEVAVEVGLSELAVHADTRLGPLARRHLGMGITLGPDADLVPIPTDPHLRQPAREPTVPLALAPPPSAEQLVLRRETVDARVRAVEPDPDGDGPILHLELTSPARTKRPTLWLQTADGRVQGEPVPAGERTRLELPDPSGPVPDRWELWARFGRRPQRLRAHPKLHTARVATVQDATGPAELVVRPTVRGRMLVELRRSQLDLSWVRAGTSGSTLVVGGTGEPDEFGPDLALELSCPWTGEHARFPVRASGSGWHAELTTDALSGPVGEPSPPRWWAMTLVGSSGSDPDLRVPAEGRERFPLTDPRCEPPVHVGIGPESQPELWTRPDDDSGRWPIMRKLERIDPDAAPAGS